MKDTVRTDLEQRSSKTIWSKCVTAFADGERRAYLVLAAFTVVLTLVNGTFTIVQNHILEHKFCQLFQASLQAGPVAKPVNPKKTPAQEKLYEDYIIVDSLGHALGCDKIP